MDPIKSLIEKYKKLISANQLKGEVYKWELLTRFQGRPDANATDFFKEIKEVKFNNLIYAMSWAVLKHMAKDRPEGLRQLFKNLYDESVDLSSRIKSFNQDSLSLYRELNGEHSHHQDERSIATYLTFHNPQQYTFYKASFYSKYCKLIGVEEAVKFEKYPHYLALIDELTETYIKPDPELIDQVRTLIPEYFDGISYKLLAQDILYQTLDQEKEPSYWIFQANPWVYDTISALKDGNLKSWTVKAHKDKISKGDKVILWITGANAGCYALMTVTSEVAPRPDDEVEMKYYTDQRENEPADRVSIKIDQNLASTPILYEDIKDLDELKELKVGKQGTNFSATEKEYSILLKMAEMNGTKKYWLYAPGELAMNWEEFYSKGIMALGWDELGDLNQYKDKKEIVKRLQEIEEIESSKKNDATANWEFKSIMSIGDVVIVKKGRGELLGYGIVTSEYYFNPERKSYQKCRRVDWKKKGTWATDHSLALKTLTDITNYNSEHPSYQLYWERLLGTMEDQTNPTPAFPLNEIFYGPPGTGKTYHTVLHAAQIIENREILDYQEALKIFNEHLGERIEFITFHQNYSYEDFIQGLRPDIEHTNNLVFERKDGVFTRMAVNALFEYYKVLKKPLNGVKTTTSHTDLNEIYLDFIDHLKAMEPREFKSATGSPIYISSFTKKDNIEFKHKNSSRTYIVSGNRLLKLFEAFPDIKKIKNIQDDIRNTIGGCNTTVYWVALKAFIDFCNQNTKIEIADPEEQYDDLSYERKKKLLGTIDLNELRSAQGDKVPTYVMIIDEINRANISRVFGELITLIEDDKRSHGAIPLRCTLPSGEDFIVPSNLYIIGTMNTADKSIALLDIALRRRFVFEAMYPKYHIEGHDVYDVEILEKINKKVIDLKGHDFQIGHAYFMEENRDLIDRMNNKVIPLLLEYFMNDYNEVKSILAAANLKVEENIYPLRIARET